MNMSKIRLGRQVLVSLVIGLGVGVSAVQAQSGNLEPPGSAVDGGGNPVATTQTQPSWDQGLPAAERFVLVLGGEAVLDKETGLVWEQSPPDFLFTWINARFWCFGSDPGDKRGWRLPSMHELGSLFDPTNDGGNPDLPAGHPFSNVQSSNYWSATTDAHNSTHAWSMNFENGLGGTVLKTDNFPRVWCVRGGGPLSEY